MITMRRLVPTRRRRRDERGAVLVEVTLLLPVMILLVFGVIEFSFAFQGAAAVSDAVRAGGRTASALPAQADFIEQTQQATAARMNDIRGVTPEELWIYDANAAGYPGASNGFSSFAGVIDCYISSLDAERGCVTYTWNSSTSSWSPAGGNWPATRLQPDDYCGETADEVGVYVKAHYNSLTKLFGQSHTMQDRAIFRFEPQPSCN